VPEQVGGRRVARAIERSATPAGSITGQANSATIPATSANTPTTIVQRNAGGNFACLLRRRSGRPGEY